MATKKKKTKKEINISFYLDMKKDLALDCEIHKFFWSIGTITGKGFLKNSFALLEHLIWKLRNPNKYFSQGKRISKKRFNYLEDELGRIKKYEIDRWLDEKIWGIYLA